MTRIAQRGSREGTGTAGRWLLLVYRVPSEPSNNRVRIWRDLKRTGVLYLQQCVCVVPVRPGMRKAMDKVRQQIAQLGGSSDLFELPSLPAEQRERLVTRFRELVAKQYAEIVEECETKFVKEVEFETYRQNFSFAEADEIEQDLEKIRRWYERARERDWFGAAGREDVDLWIERCQTLLDGYEHEVHARAAAQNEGPDASEAAPVPVAVQQVVPLRKRVGGVK